MVSSGTRASLVWIDSYMASGSEPGKSVRPQPFEEEGVARHQTAVDEEALAAGRVAGRVDQLHGDVAHPQDLPAVVPDQVGAADARRPLDPGHLVRLDVHRHLDLLEQRADAFERPAPHLATEVVRVEVGAEHARQAHTVRLHDVEQVLDGVGGVDDDGLAASRDRRSDRRN